MTEKSIIDKHLKNIERNVIAHCGSGGASHSTVNRSNNGFAEPKHVTRVFLEQGTNIDEVSDGFYYGYKLKNVPEKAENAICLLDVRTSGEGRRDYYLKLSSDGQSWEKTIHTGGIGGSGWIFTQGYLFYLAEDNMKTPSGADCQFKLTASPLGRGGTLVSLFLKISDVHKIPEGKAEAIHQFGNINIRPKAGFFEETLDWNIPVDGERRYCRVLVSETAISVARSKNCTDKSNFRFYINWVI